MLLWLVSKINLLTQHIKILGSPVILPMTLLSLDQAERGVSQKPSSGCCKGFLVIRLRFDLWLSYRGLPQSCPEEIPRCIWLCDMDHSPVATQIQISLSYNPQVSGGEKLLTEQHLIHTLLHKFLNLIERLHSEYIDWPKILDVLPEAVGEHISIIKHPIDTANAPTHGHTSSTITNKYAAENTVKKLHYRPISPFSLYQFLCFKLRFLARLFTDSLLAVL